MHDYFSRGINNLSQMWQAGFKHSLHSNVKDPDVMIWLTLQRAAVIKKTKMMPSGGVSLLNVKFKHGDNIL